MKKIMQALIGLIFVLAFVYVIAYGFIIYEKASEPTRVWLYHQLKKTQDERKELVKDKIVSKTYILLTNENESPEDIAYDLYQENIINLDQIPETANDIAWCGGDDNGVVKIDKEEKE